MTSTKDAEIKDRIVRQLETERSDLDPAIAMRLDRARHQAMAETTGTEKPFRPWPWLATAGAASLAVLVVIQLNQPTATLPPDTLDLDLLTRAEFDLLDQDPEFMLWLAEQAVDLPIDDSDVPPEGSS